MKIKGIVWIVKDRVLVGIKRDGDGGYTVYNKNMTQESTISSRQLNTMLKEGAKYYTGNVIEGYKPKERIASPSIFIEELVDTSLPIFTIVHFHTLSVGYTRDKAMSAYLAKADGYYALELPSIPKVRSKNVPNIIGTKGKYLDRNILRQMETLPKTMFNNFLEKHDIIKVGDKIGPNSIYVGNLRNKSMDFDTIIKELESYLDNGRIYAVDLNPNTIVIKFEDMSINNKDSKKYRKDNPDYPKDEYVVLEKVLDFDEAPGVIDISNIIVKKRT